jgi:hypothetical protein
MRDGPLSLGRCGSFLDGAARGCFLCTAGHIRSPLMSLEELHGALVRLCLLSTLEGSKITTLACFGILLP